MNFRSFLNYRKEDKRAMALAIDLSYMACNGFGKCISLKDRFYVHFLLGKRYRNKGRSLSVSILKSLPTDQKEKIENRAVCLYKKLSVLIV